MQAVGIRLDFLTHLVPIFSGHDDVANDHIRPALGELLHQLLSRRDGDDIKIRLSKGEFNDLLDGQAVVSE